MSRRAPADRIDSEALITSMYSHAGWLRWVCALHPLMYAHQGRGSVVAHSQLSFMAETPRSLTIFVHWLLPHGMPRSVLLHAPGLI